MMRRRHYHPLPPALCLPLGLLGAVLGRYAILLPWLYADLLRDYPQLRRPLQNAEVPGLVGLFAVLCGAVAVVVAAASFAGVVRRRWVLWWIRKTCVAVYALGLLYLYVVLKVTGAVFAAGLDVDGMVPDRLTMAGWWWTYLSPAAAGLVGVGLLHVTTWRGVALRLYTGSAPEGLAPGDRIVENIRTHGQDPQYRKSLLTSVGTHVAIILVPLLLDLYGCAERYLVPFGSGTPSVAFVEMIQRKPKKKKKKKFILNPESAIYFHVPDLEESDILKEVQEMTELTYQADPNAVLGKMGEGGGKKGGWPEGTGNEPIRFIRLEYDGRDWDDGMDAVTRSDRNFLEELKRQTGFRVARQSESRKTRELRRFEKGYAPPFVYMTGSRHIRMSERDLKILRDYLHEGGMLFADCGSRGWHDSFRSFVNALFPGKRLVVIADDDPIFQLPYTFPNGAPPLWHHGGMRALGIKHEGRWVVFYHPGDINDAWKTGHSGLDRRLARGAFQMGINIVYYSFTHYLAATRKYRK